MLTLLIGFRLPADRICPGATDKDTCGFHRFAASACSFKKSLLQRARHMAGTAFPFRGVTGGDLNSKPRMAS